MAVKPRTPTPKPGRLGRALGVLEATLLGAGMSLGVLIAERLLRRVMRRRAARSSRP
jgi:hypothetical protein